jgi:hypothetical protein
LYGEFVTLFADPATGDATSAELSRAQFHGPSATSAGRLQLPSGYMMLAR